MPLNNTAFHPAQPEMKFHSSFYIECKPANALGSDISLLYEFNLNEKLSNMLPVIPDGCLDLLFCCDPSRPFAVVAVSPRHRCSYQFRTDVTYFGIRLIPNQTSLQFHCSIKELLQYEQIPLFDIAKVNRNLLEKIASLSTFQERVAFFTSFLLRKQDGKAETHTLLSYCLNTIYAAKGLINIQKLAETAGYSDRYIRKNFEQSIGFSPKGFSQIVRLQYSVQELLFHNLNLNSLIESCDFYDKAHFYKDFQKYMSLTPIQYMDTYSLNRTALGDRQ